MVCYQNPKLYSLHYCFVCHKASFHHYKVYRMAICEVCDICGQREVVQTSSNPIELHRLAHTYNKLYAVKTPLSTRILDWIRLRLTKE